MPKELAGQDAAAFEKAPVGTGPYYLESYQQGGKAVLKRNTGYWKPDLPKTDSVEVRFLVEQNTQLQQAQTGELDIMGELIPSGSYSAITGDPTLTERIKRRMDVAVFYVTMDTRIPRRILSNVKVRQAINMAIDKANIIKLNNGRGGPLECIFPPDMPGFDPTCDPYTYDVAAAQALMVEAGFPDGFETTIYADTTDISDFGTQSIQQDLAKIGIKVKIVQQEFDVLLGTITVPHQAPLVFVGWFQDFPDPSDFIDPDPVLRHCRGRRVQHRAVLQPGGRRARRHRARRAGRREAVDDVPGHPEADHGRRAVGPDHPERDGRS